MRNEHIPSEAVAFNAGKAVTNIGVSTLARVLIGDVLCVKIKFAGAAGNVTQAKAENKALGQLDVRADAEASVGAPGVVKELALQAKAPAFGRGHGCGERGGRHGTKGASDAVDTTKRNYMGERWRGEVRGGGA